MNRMSSKQLAAVAIAALAVMGGGAAVAAASSNGTSSTSTAAVATRRPGAALAAAASYLGVTADALRSDLQSGKTLADVAKATDGKTVDGLIAAIVAVEQAEHPSESSASITQRVTDFVNGAMPPGGPGFGHGHGPVDLSTAASYLGLTASDLQSQLQSGKTLAQIANATSGKSADGLIKALVAADTTRITAFVNGTAPTA